MPQFCLSREVDDRRRGRGALDLLACEMFELENFLWLWSLERGCLAVAWVFYALTTVGFWASIFGLVMEIFALFYGIEKVRIFATLCVQIVVNFILKYIYRKFIKEIEKLDRVVVVWPILHLFISIFASVPIVVLTLFAAGVVSDAIYIAVIVLVEIVNCYCLLAFWSLYRRFQNGEPLTNEV